MLEVVQGGVLAVFPRLGLVDEAVVVIDHTTVHLAGVDRLEHRAVAPVEAGIALHPLEPFQGGGFALEFQHRADNGLEVGSGRGCGPAAFPGWVRQVEQGLGQVGLLQLGRVVDEHRGARGDAHPVAMGWTIGRGHLLQGGRSHFGEQPGVVHQAMAGEFSVRNTSAGEARPSCTSWLPISLSSPLRRVTLIPVSRVKPSTQALVRPSCWALYTSKPSASAA